MQNNEFDKEIVANTHDGKEEPAKTQEQEQIEEGKQETPGQDIKTPNNELYAALKEERTKRKELAKDLQELKDSLDSSKPKEEEVEEEVDAVDARIKALEDELKSSKEENKLASLQSSYPALKDKAEEFEEYRNDNPGLPLEAAAKSFLVDNNLLSSKPKRKGVEQPTGGAKDAPKAGYSSEDIKNLRENYPRRYTKLLQEGKIDPDEIRS